MGKKKEQYCPLTRWRYFTKTLYHDPSATGEFTYDGVCTARVRPSKRWRAATPGSRWGWWA